MRRFLPEQKLKLCAADQNLYIHTHLYIYITNMIYSYYRHCICISETKQRKSNVFQVLFMLKHHQKKLYIYVILWLLIMSFCSTKLDSYDLNDYSKALALQEKDSESSTESAAHQNIRILFAKGLSTNKNIFIRLGFSFDYPKNTHFLYFTVFSTNLFLIDCFVVPNYFIFWQLIPFHLELHSIQN